MPRVGRFQILIATLGKPQHDPFAAPFPFVIHGLRRLQTQCPRVQVEDPQDAVQLTEVADAHPFEIRNPPDPLVLVLLFRDPLQLQ